MNAPLRNSTLDHDSGRLVMSMVLKHLKLSVALRAPVMSGCYTRYVRDPEENRNDKYK